MYKELRGKKLLILGGILSMIEVIQRAHEYGIHVTVTDYLENSPAKKYADKSFLISTTDVDAVVELCRKESIDGIYTGNVDLLLPYYADICEKTGLPCYGTKEHFKIMTDKKLFKDICRKYGVPTIHEYTLSDIKNNNIKYPVIVKPIDSSGSRGISICHNKDELESGIEKALSFSPSKQYIVEQYMTGDEVVLYYYFQDGNPVFIGMCDRYVDNEQQGVAQLPTAYIFPSKHLDDHLKNTDGLIKNMFKGLKMQNGPIFLQGFIENGIPYIYEPGYRTNGAREQYIFGSINNVDSVDMLLHFALTGRMSDINIEKISDPFIHGKYACKLSPLIKKGKVEQIVGLDDIIDYPSVVKVVLNNNVGDEITDDKIGTLQQVAYRAFIVEDSLSALKDTIDSIYRSVKYYDTNGSSMMLKEFDTSILLKDY